MRDEIDFRTWANGLIEDRVNSNTLAEHLERAYMLGMAYGENAWWIDIDNDQQVAADYDNNKEEEGSDKEHR